jgi:hypothetical protein
MKVFLPFVLLFVAQIASAADPVPLVKTMTDPSATWEARCRAEDDLTNCVPRETLLALLQHAELKMPGGAIWNGAGRDFDKQAPVAWQIFYATHRAWDVHTKKLTAAERQTLWPDLLRRTTTATAKVKVLQELANRWVPEAEAEAATLLADPKQEFPVRRSAGFCLALHAGKQHHDQLVALLEDAPAGERKSWFDVLADPRHQRLAGVDARVVRLGFTLLEEERKRPPDNIHGAYFLAITLGSYLGQEFAPDQKDAKYHGPDGGLAESFFTDTVRNAEHWWGRNRDKYREQNR